MTKKIGEHLKTFADFVKITEFVKFVMERKTLTAMIFAAFGTSATTVQQHLTAVHYKDQAHQIFQDANKSADALIAFYHHTPAKPVLPKPKPIVVEDKIAEHVVLEKCEAYSRKLMREHVREYHGGP